MVLKLYGWRPSPPVRAVMVVLYEKGVPFEFIDVELPKSEHKKPGYNTIHPFTQVPAIVSNFTFEELICPPAHQCSRF